MNQPQTGPDSWVEGRAVALPFAAIVLAMLPPVLDQTVLATALPTIASDLGGLDQLPWVVTVYVLGAAASTPIWGKVSDLYGRKELLRLAIVVFVAASALSGLAQSIGELVAARAVQGVAAGGVMTLAMAAVGDLVPPRQRGRYQGYIQGVFVAASVAGPLLGGIFVDQLSWRWVFYVNVPVGAAALAMLGAYLPTASERRSARVDAVGAGLLAAAVSAIVLITAWGGDRYDWASPVIVGLAFAAVILVTAFVWQERRVPEPVLPLRLFGERVFVVVSAGLFVATLSLFAAVVFLPVFLQIATGASATLSGLLLLPLLVASAVSTVVAGRIMAATGRYKLFPVTGLALMSVGLLLFSRLDASSSRTTAGLFMVVFGLGFGLVSQILTVAIQNAVDRREIGVATASANLFRSLGGAFGVAIYGAVFAAGLRHSLPRDLPGQLPAGVDPKSIQASPDRIHTFPLAVQHGIAQAVADSLHSVFLVAAPIALAGFLIALLLKEHPLAGPGRATDTRRPVTTQEAP
jgi:EmrB/QacA subfamily drug resistance transporter